MNVSRIYKNVWKLMNSMVFKYVPDHSKTQELCCKVVEKDSMMLKFVLDHFMI